MSLFAMHNIYNISKGIFEVSYIMLLLDTLLAYHLDGCYTACMYTKEKA